MHFCPFIRQPSSKQLFTKKMYVITSQLAGLKNILDIPVNRAVLMFWPTDDAIKAVPDDVRARLTDPSHLARFVKYHVVTQIHVS